MRNTVPTSGLTAEQLDGLACIECGSTDTPQRPTGDRAPSGVQLFRCSSACPTDEEAPASSVAIVLVERVLAPGVLLLCRQVYGTLRATFDPAQITQAAARVLLAEAADQHPTARAVAFTDAGRTVITHIPADERPAQIVHDADGQLTVTYDDTRMTGEQYLALVDKAATL